MDPTRKRPENSKDGATFQLLSLVPGGDSGKEPTCQCRKCKRYGFDPWVRKIPWRRAWQPSPVFFPGKSYGKKSLVDYSTWGPKESDMTEVT